MENDEITVGGIALLVGGLVGAMIALFSIPPEASFFWILGGAVIGGAVGLGAVVAVEWRIDRKEANEKKRKWIGSGM